MSDATESPSASLPSPAPGIVSCMLGGIGCVAFVAALPIVRRFQFNVVTYTAQADSSPQWLMAAIFGGLVVVGLIGLGLWASRSGGGKVCWRTALCVLAPLLLCLPLVVIALFAAPPYWTLLLLMLGAAWAACRAATVGERLTPRRWGHAAALAGISAAIVLLTVVHTRIQINFFEHFALGHADFGHFTEELKNVWAGRGLRCDSFENTRLGWHFVPLLYCLAPGYALFPSPVYLMACSALFVHLPALVAYYLARKLSGSAVVGLMFALAWLLLPSLSRLVYSNTYGFQWIYLAMTLIGLMVCFGVTGRFKAMMVCVVLVLLCKETAAAATFGWGLYLILFTVRRRTGVVILLVSIGYFVVCAKLFIPYFAVEGQYERLSLFGELGGSLGEVVMAPFVEPGLFFSRLIRRESVYFAATLIVSIGCLPLMGWRVAAASLPTLVLVLLLDNTEWLSIKFWHQCTLLPILFLAGITAMGRPENEGDSEQGRGNSGILRWICGVGASRKSVCFGLGAAALTAAALGHYFLGFSPMAKPYGPYRAAAALHQPDPRLAVVQRWRDQIPRDKSILASERLAAHFTNYRRLYTGRREGAVEAADYVLIDRRDSWDTSGLVQRAAALAADPRFRVIDEAGTLIALERRREFPATPLE